MTTDLMFCLLRSAVTGDKPEEPIALTPAEGEALYRLCARFDMAHLAGYALARANAFPNEALSQAFCKNQMEALVRTEQQEYEKERIGDVLERAGIDHIFLKGAVLRSIYPEKWMRTGSDVDLLVRREEHEQALNLLLSELGYTLILRTPHDAGFATPIRQHIELHKKLTGLETEASKNVLSHVWEHSVPADGKRFERVLSPEFFYVYHVLHMARHMTEGGCGVRPFLDLRLMERAMPRDKEKTDMLLREAGGLLFAEVAERLSKQWFADGEGDALCDRMAEFILAGGTFGSVTKKAAAGQAIRGGKMKNLLSLAFLPYEVMVNFYPPLKTHPWRLPYYEVCRWCRLLFRGSARRVLAELRENQTVKTEEIRVTESLLKDLGLL